MSRRSTHPTSRSRLRSLSTHEREEALQRYSLLHPMKRLGTPAEISEMVVFFVQHSGKLYNRAKHFYRWRLDRNLIRRDAGTSSDVSASPIRQFATHTSPSRSQSSVAVIQHHGRAFGCQSTEADSRFITPYLGSNRFTRVYWR